MPARCCATGRWAPESQGAGRRRRREPHRACPRRSVLVYLGAPCEVIGRAELSSAVMIGRRPRQMCTRAIPRRSVARSGRGAGPPVPMQTCWRTSTRRRRPRPTTKWASFGSPPRIRDRLAVATGGSYNAEPRSSAWFMDSIDTLIVSAVHGAITVGTPSRFVSRSKTRPGSIVPSRTSGQLLDVRARRGRIAAMPSLPEGDAGWATASSGIHAADRAARPGDLEGSCNRLVEADARGRTTPEARGLPHPFHGLPHRAR